jgi:hypothetical protein
MVFFSPLTIYHINEKVQMQIIIFTEQIIKMQGPNQPKQGYQI